MFYTVSQTTVVPISTSKQIKDKDWLGPFEIVSVCELSDRFLQINYNFLGSPLLLIHKSLFCCCFFGGGHFFCEEKYQNSRFAKKNPAQLH